MPRLLLLIAAIATVAVAFMHVALGGPLVVDALRAEGDLPAVVVWLSYFTWHDGTVALLVCAAAFVYAALKPGNRALGVFAGVLVLGIGLLGLATAVFGSGALWRTPAPYAFGVIGLLALAGALSPSRR
ncbi:MULTISPECIES: hypothetical protein [Hyphobacterium]|uniref:DUF423 domain-containing protein n=1 Tax=Hyphobacterium vulgare TaxID=1736751 RepID=A0ABV6ZU42_9PROT